MLEELGQPYERVLIDLSAGAQATQEYRRVNPMGKVPALRDGAVEVAESGAVLAYLGDRYPEAGLAPAIADPDRGRYLQWLFFSGSCLEPALGEKVGKATPNPMQNGWGSYDRVMAVIEAGLAGGPWLLGERFSAADVLMGTDLNFVCRIVPLVPETPAITAYLGRCTARPAFQRAVEIDRAASAP
jgi:glutathione S-transferase